MTNYELMDWAKRARATAYAPYSGYQVGAALLTKSGKVYTGCNIENASYSATMCAERTALFHAVSEGEREFAAIALSGGRTNARQTSICTPCGVCRQVLSEFCGDDFRIILSDTDGSIMVYSLSVLFPLGFSADKLTK